MEKMLLKVLLKSLGCQQWCVKEQCTEENMKTCIYVRCSMVYIKQEYKIRDTAVPKVHMYFMNDPEGGIRCALCAFILIGQKFCEEIILLCLVYSNTIILTVMFSSFNIILQ
jgi:hypothetical protein